MSASRRNIQPLIRRLCTQVGVLSIDEGDANEDNKQLRVPNIASTRTLVAVSTTA